jgi:hypothetical protein
VLARGLDSSIRHEQGLDRALEHEVQAGRFVSLLGYDLASAEHPDLRDGRPARELLVVELVEQVNGSEVCDGDGCGAHVLARYSWMSDTAIDPSPTALATRLIERARTSPATNTPGTLVSST